MGNTIPGAPPPPQKKKKAERLIFQYFTSSKCHTFYIIKYKASSADENDSKIIDRINITQPNSMILVLFFSAEDASFNDIKKYDTFRSQGTKKKKSAVPLFLGHQVYLSEAG